MNKEKALKKLFSLHQFGVKLGLENINRLLKYLGTPQNELKAIHIAGSNGKGSTASFIASILTEAGFKVGLYTSPHFIDFNERIRINGEKIPDKHVVDFMTKMDSYIDENDVTFFELTTALAFEYFRNQKIDYAVIETGLGGRLDATNVIDPLASVITSISLEHTNILGTDIEIIAAEKGGIIKQNSKLFLGYMPEAAASVLEKKASELGTKIFHLKNFTQVDEDFIKLKLKAKIFSLYKTPIAGIHQLKNAALAILAVREIFSQISDESCLDGISNVIRNTGIEGRYEIYNESPKIIFDSAHNVEGIAAFIDEFKKEYLLYENRTIIFGAMGDKNLPEMIKAFCPYFTKVFVTSIDYERAAKINELLAIFEKENLRAEPLKDCIEFLIRFKENRSNSCLVILGSIYLLGELKTQLNKKDLTFYD